MGQDQLQGRPMTETNEESKRTPDAQGQNPPSTTSEPGYGGSQGQQQPMQGGQRPAETEQDRLPGEQPAEGARDPMDSTDSGSEGSGPLR